MPLGFSNSSAGPPFFTLRSANSVISSSRIHFERNALQLPVLFQRANELAQIGIGHNIEFNHDQTRIRTAFDHRRQPRHRTRLRSSTRVRRSARDPGRARSPPNWKPPPPRFPGPLGSTLDLSSHESIKEAFAKAGRVDILVNNAAITKDGLALRMKKDDWDTVSPPTSPARFSRFNR